MEFLALLLLAVTIVVIYHVIVHLWETRKPTEWKEPTDCDNNFCDCASLAHPADNHPENRWKDVKFEPLKFEFVPYDMTKDGKPKKATVKAKKATKKKVTMKKKAKK
jgi:hypothetical protein